MCGQELYLGFSAELEEVEQELKKLFLRSEYDPRNIYTQHAESVIEEEITQKMLELANIINHTLSSVTISSKYRQEISSSIFDPSENQKLFSEEIKSEFIGILQSILKYLHLEDDRECMNNIKVVEMAISVVFANAVSCLQDFDWKHWSHLRRLLVDSFDGPSLVNLMSLSERIMFNDTYEASKSRLEGSSEMKEILTHLESLLGIGNKNKATSVKEKVLASLKKYFPLLPPSKYLASVGTTFSILVVAKSPK